MHIYRQRWMIATLIVLLCLPLLAQAQRRQPKSPAKSLPKVAPKAGAASHQEIAKAVSELSKAVPLFPAEIRASLAVVDDKGDGRDNDEDEKAPADDAPLKTLLDYWRALDKYGRHWNLKPSPTVVERLLTAGEARPWLLAELTAALPLESAVFDRVYRVWQKHSLGADEESWPDDLKEWLMQNSDYFREDLLREAQKRVDALGARTQAIESLAKLNWEAAQPYLAQLEPATRLETEYEHALRIGNASEVERLRSLLQTLVRQRKDRDARDTALNVLLKHDWPGRETWYVSLFADPSLTGASLPDAPEPAVEPDQDSAESQVPIQRAPIAYLLASLIEREPEQFLPLVIGLVGNSNPAVHEGAVSLLLTIISQNGVRRFDMKQSFKHDVARALTPWLTNPQWADKESRQYYVRELAGLTLPEAWPGLLSVLENDEDASIRASAAWALLAYRNPASAPALRQALEHETNDLSRPKLIAALYESGGIPDEEAADAIEASARVMTEQEGNSERTKLEGNVTPLKLSIGSTLSHSQSVHLTEGLVTRLFERVRQVRRTQSALAKELLRVTENLSWPVVDRFFVERIAEGWIDADALKLALERQNTLKKYAGDELAQLSYGSGYAAGVATALLDNQDRARALLKGQDQAAQKALLAAARYLRGKLPVAEVGALLSEKLVADFAESYLSTEDSRAARELVWARHPNEALILGVSASEISFIRFYNESASDAFSKYEKRLRDELKTSNAPKAIYAMLNTSMSDAVEVRVWPDRAELRVYADEIHWRARRLTANELAELQALIARPETEDLGPESWGKDVMGSPREFVRVSLDGGRRIQLESWRNAPTDATLHEMLAGLFVRLKRAGDYQWQFALTAHFPGLTVIKPDELYQPEMLCQDRGQMRVVVVPKDDSERNEFTMPQVEERSLTMKGFGERMAPALACYSPRLEAWRKILPLQPDAQQESKLNNIQRLALMSLRFRFAMDYAQVSEALETANKLGEKFVSPLLTPDGQWLVGAQQVEKKDDSPDLYQLVRYHIPTKKKYVIGEPAANPLNPVMWLALQRKMLMSERLLRAESGDETNEVSLLDPVTGTVEKVKGEFRPLLAGLDLRTLQPTARPNEYWAALSDEEHTRIGRYDALRFTFTPQLELPGMSIKNAEFWLDETRRELWLIYKTHILHVPLANKLK